MTPKQAREQLRSLRYRERLWSSRREAELLAYLLEQGGVAVIDGYRVTFKDGRLMWEKLPNSLFKQLSLFPEEVSR